MNNVMNSVDDEIQIVESEVRNAYSDCHEYVSSGERDLDFRASTFIPLWDAIRIMSKYVGSYNDFQWHFMQKFPGNCMVQLAREGSVCMYVKFPVQVVPQFIRNLKDVIRADECGTGPDVLTYRFWWD